MRCPETLNGLPVLAHVELASRRSCTVLVDKTTSGVFDEEYVVAVHAEGTTGWDNGNYLQVSREDAIAWFLVYTARKVGVEI